MSLDRPSGARSAATEPDPEILLDALADRVAGAREHAEATASYAFATAVELGLDRDFCAQVRAAARLHEIGKLYVRRELLARSDDELSRRARAELEAHPAAGARLARGAGFSEPVCELVLRCGERFDGEGREMDAADAPLGSRIVTAACEYDRQLARHTGPGGGGRRWALIAVVEQSGSMLDPLVVDALARVVERAQGAAG
jgi:HD-GYP domain-containing protein (c-di-GMP phosphodiesterase class II)